MSSSHSREGWPPPSGSSNHVGLPRGSEQLPPRQTGQANSYGSSTPSHQSQQPSAPPLMAPPQGSYYPPPHSGPSLPAISGLSHHSPSMVNQRPPHEQGAQAQHQPVQLPGSGFSLPSISAGASEAGSAPTHDRDREAQDARDRDILRRDEQRDREIQARETQERTQELTPTHQTSVESVQLHQPVAVGSQMRSAIHGPNGLLANATSAASQNPPSAGQAFFESASRSGQQPAHASIPNMAPFNGNPNTHPSNMAGIGQGQQPILNDALTYLDQVKVQFSGEPNVYNQFLDIMKDFKSQAIDTPGVIRRVSELFAGNPNLIQGFNTFLPPGYRIECGTADDPNAIRVTTPMGTSIDPAGGSRPVGGADAGPSQERQGFESFGAGGAGWLHPGEGERSDGILGQREGSRNQQSPFEPGAGRDHNSSNTSLLAQQQQAQNNVSAAAAQPAIGGRETASPLVEPAIPAGAGLNGGLAGVQQGPASLEKRGPTEFNHAISYVNKIKNRFASQPEIYKQFLEILQTFQRESKPIQDVYAQVTNLFNGAPDLLEDFKQFLPESAAHAKSIAARQQAEDPTTISNVRGEPGYSQAALPQQTPRPDRMPPIGNFAPTPSAGRDAKRKRGDRHGMTTSSAVGSTSNEYPPGSMATAKNGFFPNKRTKASSQAAPATGKMRIPTDLPPVEPALVPALPEPLPPSTSSTATADELAFFDRVKKHLGNKNSMNEFLKLCNLYSQDLIDKGLLVFRAQGYLGANSELLTWFKGFVGYDDSDQIIENKARETGSGRINLNNCRSYGPSYRLLPRRERNKLCSGRDELCNSVLNDDWASHPTWASEDSGFIAHRKNTHEEGLHRIEEERHDYDLWIAACERFVQILEPLAVQNSLKSEEERRQWTLTPDFGGQTQAIYRKIVGKIYSRPEAQKILDALISQPTLVVPVLLQRCRIMLEMWKVAQREWEKIWRDQTNKMFWKSLDHLGINAKAADKRQFQTKTLQTEIQTKYEEQKRLRAAGKIVPNVQAEYVLRDHEVLIDAVHLLLTHAEQAYSTDFPRLTQFLKEFVPVFFNFNADELHARIYEEFEATPTIEDVEEEPVASDDSGQSRSRRSNAKPADLLRGVLDKARQGKASRTDKESSLASGSRASTPDVGLLPVDEDGDEAMVDGTDFEHKVRTWLDHPLESDHIKNRILKATDPYRRTNYNLYGNLPIYCFFRTFVVLYERLNYIKISEQEVQDAVRRAKQHKAAGDLKMVDKQPDIFFNNTSAGANFYTQMLQMFEDVAKGTVQMDMTPIEDTLRRYYLKHGYLLYNLDKLLSALVRFGLNILANDANFKSQDLIALFYADRKKETTTFADELAYRKKAEKLTKEGDMYRICYIQSDQRAHVRILRKDENTLDPTTGQDDLLTPEQQWQYYVSSFEMLEATEGVDLSSLSRPYLERTVHKVHEAMGADPEEEPDIWTGADQIRSSESLRFRITLTRFRIIWNEGTFEWWVREPSRKVGKLGERKPESPIKDLALGEALDKNATHGDAKDTEGGSGGAQDDQVKDAPSNPAEGTQRDEDHRDGPTRFMEKFVMNNSWMANQPKDEVDKINAEFRAWRGSMEVEGEDQDENKPGGP